MISASSLMTCTHDHTIACVLRCPFHKVKTRWWLFSCHLSALLKTQLQHDALQVSEAAAVRKLHCFAATEAMQNSITITCDSEYAVLAAGRTHEVAVAAPLRQTQQQLAKHKHNAALNCMPRAQTSSTALHTSLMSAVSSASSCCSAFCTCTTSPSATQSTSDCPVEPGEKRMRAGTERTTCPGCNAVPRVCFVCIQRR